PARWRLFDGNYSAYVDSMRRAAEETGGRNGESKSPEPNDPAVRPESTKDKPRRKRKFPYRKVHDLEAEIAAAETLLGKLQDDLARPEIFRDGNLARETTQEFESKQSRLAQLYEHWEESVELN